MMECLIYVGDVMLLGVAVGTASAVWTCIVGYVLRTITARAAAEDAEDDLDFKSDDKLLDIRDFLPELRTDDAQDMEFAFTTTLSALRTNPSIPCEFKASYYSLFMKYDDIDDFKRAYVDYHVYNMRGPRFMNMTLGGTMQWYKDMIATEFGDVDLPQIPDQGNLAEFLNVFDVCALVHIGDMFD